MYIIFFWCECEYIFSSVNENTNFFGMYALCSMKVCMSMIYMTNIFKLSAYLILSFFCLSEWHLPIHHASSNTNFFFIITFITLIYLTNGFPLNFLFCIYIFLVWMWIHFSSVNENTFFLVCMFYVLCMHVNDLFDTYIYNLSAFHHA